MKDKEGRKKRHEEGNAFRKDPSSSSRAPKSTSFQSTHDGDSEASELWVCSEYDSVRHLDEKGCENEGMKDGQRSETKSGSYESQSGSIHLAEAVIRMIDLESSEEVFGME